MSWSVIGAFVGTSGEAARQRYGAKVARLSPDGGPSHLRGSYRS